MTSAYSVDSGSLAGGRQITENDSRQRLNTRRSCSCDVNALPDLSGSAIPTIDTAPLLIADFAKKNTSQ